MSFDDGSYSMAFRCRPRLQKLTFPSGWSLTKPIVFDSCLNSVVIKRMALWALVQVDATVLNPDLVAEKIYTQFRVRAGKLGLGLV